MLDFRTPPSVERFCTAVIVGPRQIPGGCRGCAAVGGKTTSNGHTNVRLRQYDPGSHQRSQFPLVASV